MATKLIDTIFTKTETYKTTTIEVPADVADRINSLFAERRATKEQRRAFYATALRRLLETIDKPAKEVTNA